MNENETNVAIFVTAGISFVGFVTYAVLAKRRIKALEKAVQRKEAVIEAVQHHFDMAVRYVPTEKMPELYKDMQVEIAFLKIAINEM